MMIYRLEIIINNYVIITSASKLENILIQLIIHIINELV